MSKNKKSLSINLNFLYFLIKTFFFLQPLISFFFLHLVFHNALKRFKRQCARNGVMQEVRKREHYEKPSVKRKKKSEAARKRKF